MNKKIKEILIVLFWIAIWAFIAIIIASPIILASPYDVLIKFIEFAITANFWISILLSLLHVSIGFIIACVLGCLTAIFSYRIPTLYDFVQPPMQFFKSAPIVCIIVLILTMFGVEYVDIIVVVIAVLPIYFFAIYEACKNRNINISNLLAIHQIPKRIIWSVFEWPNALPFFNQATKVAIGISWKVAITAQMIGALNGTIGIGIYDAKIMLDSAQLFVWMISVIIISWGLEKITILFVHKLSKSDYKNVLNKITQYSQDEKYIDKNECLVKLESVIKTYNSKKVLDNINLSIKLGQKINIAGLTGAGKTTLTNIILGIEKPDSGKAIIKDCSPRTFSVVFQENSLISNLTILENIKVASLKKIEEKDVNKIVQSNLKPDELSGGMKRCAEIERAIISDSKIVVLDEPFTGLDIETRKQAIKYINENIANRALILITHDSKDAKELNCKEFKV